MANYTTKTVQETFKSPYLSWNSDASDFAVFAPIIWHDKIALTNTCQSGQAWHEFTNSSIRGVLRSISTSSKVTERVRTKATNYLEFIRICREPYMNLDMLFSPEVGQNNMHAINFRPYRTHGLQRTENIPEKNKFVINRSLDRGFISKLKEKSFESCKGVDYQAVKKDFKKEVLERVFANKFYVNNITDKADRLAVFYFHMMEIYKEKTNNNQKILTFSDLCSKDNYEFPIIFRSASSQNQIFKRVEPRDIEKIENGKKKVELNIWKAGHDQAKSCLIDIWKNYYELDTLDDNEIMETLISAHFPVNGFRISSNDLLAQMIDVLGNNNDTMVTEHINILIQLIVAQISFQLKDTGKRQEYLSNWWWGHNYKEIENQIESHIKDQNSHCIIRSLCNLYNNMARYNEKLSEVDVISIVNNTRHIWETLTSGLYSTNPKAREVMDHLDEFLCLGNTPGCYVQHGLNLSCELSILTANLIRNTKSREYAREMLKTMGDFKELPEKNHYSVPTKNTNYKIYKAILIPLLIILSWVGLVYSSYLSNQIFSILTYGNLINLGLISNLPVCQAFAVVLVVTCVVTVIVGCVELFLSNGSGKKPGPNTPPGGGSVGADTTLSNSLSNHYDNGSNNSGRASYGDQWFYENPVKSTEVRSSFVENSAPFNTSSNNEDSWGSVYSMTP